MYHDYLGREIEDLEMDNMRMDDQLQIMPNPVKHQALIDKISALMLLGKVDFYAGKQATEDGDWKQVRRLIAEGARPKDAVSHKGEEAK